MPLAPSTRLGPYEILAPLGAGGMGEVYRARDPRLNREVAITGSGSASWRKES
jgi:eukaryotic-like serine/threonine-protein kinase